MNDINTTVSHKSTSSRMARETVDSGAELRCCPAASIVVSLYGAARGFGGSTIRRLLLRLLRRFEGGEMRSATMRTIMRRFHGVVIGAHSYGCFDPLRFPAGIVVGRYVSIGPQVKIYRRNHPLDRLSLHPYFYNPGCGAPESANVPSQALEIAADSWLGAHALVLPGCHRIGRGAVVAAGAIVTRDVPDYAVVGGNPARVIRLRFDREAIDMAERSQWWQSTPEQAARCFDMTSAWQISESTSNEELTDE